MTYFKRLILIPTGSFEYHGKELPPDTDSVIATGIVRGLEGTLRALFKGDILVLPTVSYGFSIEHTGQPLTAIISHGTFYAYLRELTFSFAQPRDLIVVINGHGGNTHTIGALEGEFNASFPDRKMFFPPLHPGPVKDLCVKLVGEIDVHAGSVEASLVAYYHGTTPREYTVKLGRSVRGSLRFFRSAELAPEGVIARDSRVRADPVVGKAVHEAIVRETTMSVEGVLNSLGGFLETESMP